MFFVLEKVTLELEGPPGSYDSCLEKDNQKTNLISTVKIIKSVKL